MMYDCVIIGAGPAGLSYASSLSNQDKVVVLDMGKSVGERDRNHPEECLLGAGGAGLFSDGKFSFYPSGTKIWEQNVALLKQAFEKLRHDLSPFSTIPEFPEIDSSDKQLKLASGWSLKPYPSIYLSLNDRLKLIQNLAGKVLNIQYQTEFVNYTPVEDGYRIEIKKVGAIASECLFTKKMVWAGGRFMPHFLQCPSTFKRYEFGFRIEGPSQHFQKDDGLKDPKYLLQLAEGQFRTFCWCAEGEVVPTRMKEIQTYSGRADCPPTGRTNFGFNFRGNLSKEEFHEILSTPPYQLPLQGFNGALFPERLRPTLIEGIRQLKKQFPKLDQEGVSIKGPTVEGVGHYPTIDEQFRLQDHPNISVIGDCSGLYRGIVASMLSGYILAIIHNQGETK